MRASSTPATVFDVVRRNAEVAPDDVALSGGDRTWTHAELVDDAERLAGGLVELGLRAGDHLVVLAGNQPEVALAWLAAARSGIVPALLNSQLTPGELLAIVDRIGPSAVLLDHRRLDLFGVALGERQVPLVSIDAPIGPNGPGPIVDVDELRSGVRCRLPEPQPGDRFEITATSGTTSLPKLVAFSHGAEVAHWTEVAAALDLGPADRVRVVTPLFHSSGIRNAAFSTWCAGGSVDLAERFSASSYWSDVRKSGATWSCLVETMIAILERTPPADLDRTHSMRFVLGGGPTGVVESFERRFGIAVRQAYGMTECGCPSLPPREIDAATLARQRRYRFDAVFAGRPIPGCAIRIVSGGAPAPPGEPGEIQVRSSLRLLEYVDDRDATSAAFDAGWFRTGDIGVMSPEGFVHFVGRARDVIRRGGENLAASEVEHVVESHPAIVRCAVVGVPDEIYGQEVMAVVTTGDGAAIGPDELWTWCDERLAPFKVPRYIEFRRSLPVNASGRLRKHELGATRSDDATTHDRRAWMALDGRRR